MSGGSKTMLTEILALRVGVSLFPLPIQLDEPVATWQLPAPVFTVFA